MDYYCEVCDIIIKPKTKYNHFDSKSHQDFDNCKHIILSLKDIDNKEVVKRFIYTLLIILKNSNSIL